MKKSRLGADPLAWIASTTGNPGERAEERAEIKKEATAPGKKDAKPLKPVKIKKDTEAKPAGHRNNKHDLPHKQNKQGLQDKHVKQSLQEKTEIAEGRSDGDGDGGLQGKQGLQDIQNSERGRKPYDEDTTRKGLKDGWTRATFIVREEHAEKIRRVAWWERKKVTDVIEEALGAYLEKKRPGEE